MSSYHTKNLVLGIRTDEIAAINCLLRHTCNDQFARLDLERCCLIHDAIDAIHSLVELLNFVIAVPLCKDSLEKRVPTSES